jgi:hypothetical protein
MDLPTFSSLKFGDYILTRPTMLTLTERQRLTGQAIAGIQEMVRLRMKEGILVTGWFDESGGNDCPVATVCGYAVPPTASGQAAIDWHSRLKQDDLLSFSMKDAVTFQNNFATWKGEDDRRDALLRDLARIVSAAPFLKVSAIVRSEEFNALSEVERKKFGGDMLYCSIETCIRGILDSDNRASLHYIHDMTEKAAEFMKRFTKLRSRDQIVKDRCVAVTFADDTCHDGIQMADMAAYCMRCHFSGTRQNSIVSEVHEILSSKDRKIGKFLYIAGELVG